MFSQKNTFDRLGTYPGIFQFSHRFEIIFNIVIIIKGRCKQWARIEIRGRLKIKVNWAPFNHHQHLDSLTHDCLQFHLWYLRVRFPMCHFIVNSLRAAWIRVGVAIVVAGDRVARALGGNIYLFSKLLFHVITIGSVQRNLVHDNSQCCFKR